MLSHLFQWISLVLVLQVSVISSLTNIYKIF